MPLGGPALVVHVVGPPQVVLPLLPAGGHGGHRVLVSGPRHVLALQKLPARLGTGRDQSETRETGETRLTAHNAAQEKTRERPERDQRDDNAHNAAEQGGETGRTTYNKCVH